MPRLPFIAVVVSLLFAPLFTASAADQNGYTAQYECRAGNPQCDVNVAGLAARACDQTISPSTSPTNNWSAINWNNNTICIAPGDHRSRGALFVTASGGPSSRKVLRASTGTTAPWRQSSGDRARISRLEFNGADYWVVQGLAVDDSVNAVGIFFAPDSGATNNIVDHVLVQHHDNTLVHFMWGNPGNVLQNSVVRSTVAGDKENNCVSIGGSPDTWIVNNELSDCNKTVSAGSGVWDILGAKMENNDMYMSQDVYTDCNGNYTSWNAESPCALSETLISLKAGGNASKPVAIVHNRMWGARSGDPVILGGGNAGESPAVSISNDMPNNPHFPGADYLLIQNNIMWDLQIAIGNWWGTPDHLSIIGNLIFNIRRQQGDHPGPAIRLNQVRNAEIYFNTIIDAQRWIELLNDVQETDIRCNVVIDSPGKSGSPSSSMTVEHNAFFNAAVIATDVSPLSFSSSGQSGTVEYCFNRKLLSGPERVCIPKAKPTNASPFSRACDSTIGNRRNMGVSDAAIF